MPGAENVPSTYALRGRARNGAGWSDWGPEVDFETPPGLPPPPPVVLERQQQLIRLRIDRPAPLDYRVFQRTELVREGGARDVLAPTAAGHTTVARPSLEAGK